MNAPDLGALADLVNGDEALVRRGRFLTTTFLIEIDETAWLITVTDGRIERVERGPLLMRSWTFAIRISGDAWRRFAQPVPEAGYHDIFAMTKSGAARIDGDLHPFMANLQYMKDVLAHGSRVGSTRRASTAPTVGDSDLAAHAPTTPATISPITGRYAHLDVGGRSHRIYFEEAGRGIPLVCLHTAGSDSRQFRHLMTDEEITREFRVIAFDMPWHGKSTPPTGWEREEYRLTTQGYIATILAVSDALGLERPVALGCSIGGRIVLHLALEHPARFRALIGCEAADHQQAWYDTSWLDRPDVHGGEVSAALVSGLIGPQSPAESRGETLWTYAMSGPGVFKGDLYFYRVDSDLRDRVGAIDTARCPLYLLTGEYDFSCTPGDTMRTAKSIPGARVTIMKGLGHFPMSEDPARFREYILPVLQEIRIRG